MTPPILQTYSVDEEIAAMTALYKARYLFETWSREDGDNEANFQHMREPQVREVMDRSFPGGAAIEVYDTPYKDTPGRWRFIHYPEGGNVNSVPHMMRCLKVWEDERAAAIKAKDVAIAEMTHQAVEAAQAEVPAPRHRVQHDGD